MPPRWLTPVDVAVPLIVMVMTLPVVAEPGATTEVTSSKQLGNSEAQSRTNTVTLNDPVIMLLPSAFLCLNAFNLGLKLLNPSRLAAQPRIMREQHPSPHTTL